MGKINFGSNEETCAGNPGRIAQVADDSRGRNDHSGDVAATWMRHPLLLARALNVGRHRVDDALLAVHSAAEHALGYQHNCERHHRFVARPASKLTGTANAIDIDAGQADESSRVT